MGSLASLKTSRTLWNCDRIGKSQSDLPKTKYKVLHFTSIQFKKYIDFPELPERIYFLVQLTDVITHLHTVYSEGLWSFALLELVIITSDLSHWMALNEKIGAQLGIQRGAHNSPFARVKYVGK